MLYATAQGLRSAVSIYGSFQVTTSGGSFWNPYPVTQTYYQTGSGVLYRCEEDGSAFVVTNFHVVYNSSSDNESHISENIYLYLYGMESDRYAIAAEYVGGSADYDIAVLRVEKSAVLQAALASGSATAVTLSQKDGVLPGESLIAIGNPSTTGLAGISVTQGVVSVASEYLTMAAIDGVGEATFRVIRTDTPINGGNSGGGIYNTRGELVGIVNAKINSTKIENISYAIPVAVVAGVADNIIDNCYGKESTGPSIAMLGIYLKEVALSTVYDPETGTMTRKESIAVGNVAADSLAMNTLLEGDVLLTITLHEKTVEILHGYHYLDAMLTARVGDTVTLTVLRGGEEITVSIVLSAECFS